MILVYALAVIILACWTIKSILAGKFIFRRTPLDIFLFGFLVFQFFSTLVSIDQHTSIWGYYTRSNGGLLSTVVYITLFYAFVSNMDIRKTQNAKRYILSSALIVSIWGILEHFGRSPSCLLLTGSFDASCWVQDVQTRVFATLGQPNWMAAYLVAVMPLTWATVIGKKQKGGKPTRSNLLHFAFYFLPFAFFLALLFTKSRSGLLGFAAAFTVFWIGVAWINRKRLSAIISHFFFLFSFFFERGGTESGEIRKIVWKGAIEIWKAYPLFGSGVETFAYSYYNFRPVEHNLTSEWNFLYNKAHNEYLNFLATTGVFGLGTYLLLIGAFLLWSLHGIRNQESGIRENHNSSFIIHNSILAGYSGILVTNFFGFSVVPVALLFFLYPAMAVVVISDKQSLTSYKQKEIRIPLNQFSFPKIFGLFALLLVAFYLLLRLAQLWYADALFAQADKLIKRDDSAGAAEKLEKALTLNSGQPNYRDKLAAAYSTVAAGLAEENKPDDARELANRAQQETDKAYKTSPRNISLLKSRASTFSRLSFVDPNYTTFALVTLESAATLAPTDTVINYNFAIALYRTGGVARAIETLEKLNEIKPDYADSRFALAEIYAAEGKKEEAKRELEYILKNIDPNNETVKSLLKKL
ncbi:MAG: O-antigen ligase family protein [Candidatus Blackburnbacteria bacterium]|nr:O-antigen ligase family protein [Candidatus Blackburnbacteria bacterium]